MSSKTEKTTWTKKLWTFLKGSKDPSIWSTFEALGKSYEARAQFRKEVAEITIKQNQINKAIEEIFCNEKEKLPTVVEIKNSTKLK